MLAALATADMHTWVSILVKALTYAATLVAAGSVLVHLSLRALDAEMRRSLARLTALSAVSAAFLTAVRLPLRASFLMGGSLDGAVDTMLLGVVAESPLGNSVMLRLAGLALLLAVLVPGRGGRWTAVTGAVLVAASFAFRGHALQEPRLLLGALITLHILGLAFWIGAFAPLTRAAAARTADIAGPLSHEFGTKAVWVVAALAAAGALTLVLFGAANPDALNTSYGQAFAIKLVLFVGVLSLAAVHKLRLTPALLAGVPGAAARLQRSIRIEAALIAAILLTTAAATTVSAPPGETEQAGAPVELRNAEVIGSRHATAAR